MNFFYRLVLILLDFLDWDTPSVANFERAEVAAIDLTADGLRVYLPIPRELINTNRFFTHFQCITFRLPLPLQYLHDTTEKTFRFFGAAFGKLFLAPDHLQT